MAENDFDRAPLDASEHSTSDCSVLLAASPIENPTTALGRSVCFDQLSKDNSASATASETGALGEPSATATTEVIHTPPSRCGSRTEAVECEDEGEKNSERRDHVSALAGTIPSSFDAQYSQSGVDALFVPRTGGLPKDTGDPEFSALSARFGAENIDPEALSRGTDRTPHDINAPDRLSHDRRHKAKANEEARTSSPFPTRLAQSRYTSGEAASFEEARHPRHPRSGYRTFRISGAGRSADDSGIPGASYCYEPRSAYKSDCGDRDGGRFRGEGGLVYPRLTGCPKSAFEFKLSNDVFQEISYNEKGDVTRETVHARPTIHILSDRTGYELGGGALGSALTNAGEILAQLTKLNQDFVTAEREVILVRDPLIVDD